MKAFDELRKTASNRPSELRAFKEDGAKVVEFTGNFVPEELIYAAGARPYLLCRGGEPEAPEAVLADMLRFTNPLARSQCGFYALGIDPVTPMADMIAVSQYECHAERMAEYLELMKLPVHKVGVPNDWKREFAKDYYRNQLVDFKSALEELTGTEIEDASLAKYAEAFNRINELLRKISALRDLDEPPISGTDFIKLNHYTFFVEPELAIEKLEQVYEELKDAPGVASADAPRILVIGHSVAVGDYEVMSKIEETGMRISCEMLEEGFRWYERDLDEDVEFLDAFVEQRYLRQPPLNNMEPSFRDRTKYIKQLIEEHHIDGVIWYQLLYDEIWDVEYSNVSYQMDQAGIPIMRIDTEYEYTREAMGPLVTRLESFAKLIEMRKGGVA